jgi:hypothetical protein
MSDEGWPRHNYRALDEQKADLVARFPGWHIWYVTHAVGGVTWCAQRLPRLNEASPDDLAKAMTETEADAEEEIGRALREAALAAGSETGPV